MKIILVVKTCVWLGRPK